MLATLLTVLLHPQTTPPHLLITESHQCTTPVSIAGKTVQGGAHGFYSPALANFFKIIFQPCCSQSCTPLKEPVKFLTIMSQPVVELKLPFLPLNNKKKTQGNNI